MESPIPGFQGEYRVWLGNGQVLTCWVCSGQVFTHRLIKLNTTGASFMGLDWANADSDGLACVRCGRIDEFVQGTVRLEPLRRVEE
jgi:hypothetical protein